MPAEDLKLYIDLFGLEPFLRKKTDYRVDIPPQ
jgi:hypothetical protein